MADIDPVELGAVVRRDATSVAPSPRWAVRRAGRRMIVVVGGRALTTKLLKPLLPASALAVAAWAAARAAGSGRATRGPVGSDEIGRVLSPATLEVSWIRVEMRWRG